MSFCSEQKVSSELLLILICSLSESTPMPPQSYHKVLAVVVVDAIVDEAVGEDAQRLVRPEHRDFASVSLFGIGFGRMRTPCTILATHVTQVRLGRDRLVLITWCWRSCAAECWA